MLRCGCIVTRSAEFQGDGKNEDLLRTLEYSKNSKRRRSSFLKAYESMASSSYFAYYLLPDKPGRSPGLAAGFSPYRIKSFGQVGGPDHITRLNFGIAVHRAVGAKDLHL